MTNTTGGLLMWTLIALIGCAVLCSEVVMLRRLFEFHRGGAARMLIGLGVATRVLVVAGASLLALPGLA